MMGLQGFLTPYESNHSGISKGTYVSLVVPGGEVPLQDGHETIVLASGCNTRVDEQGEFENERTSHHPRYLYA